LSLLSRLGFYSSLCVQSRRFDCFVAAHVSIVQIDTLLLTEVQRSGSTRFLDLLTQSAVTPLKDSFLPLVFFARVAVDPSSPSRSMRIVLHTGAHQQDPLAS
jgi:hypothetical protein